MNGKRYRYGFNGKPIDKGEEGMSGGGSTYDYGFRIYNPNLGRFLSIDPLSASYPWYTPYQFAGNMPIWAIDLDGLEQLIYSKNTVNNYYSAILMINSISILTYYGGLFSTELKNNKHKINVMINVGLTGATDAQTNYFKTYEEFLKAKYIDYNPETGKGTQTHPDYKNIDDNEAKEHFKNGHKLVLISLNESDMKKLQEQIKLGKKMDVKKVRKMAGAIAKHKVHEEAAHIIQILKNPEKAITEESILKQHEDYEGKKSWYTPDEPIKGSKAYRTTKEIEKLVQTIINKPQ